MHGGASPQGGASRGAITSRQPPSWSPERESVYPFRHWVQDLLAGSVSATDMDSARQCAAVIPNL
eukprot:3696610-Pyramimonas_sp.AAC.1